MRMSVPLREKRNGWHSVTPLEISGITYVVNQVQYVLIKFESNPTRKYFVSKGFETGGVTGLLNNSRFVIYIIDTSISI